MAQQLNAYAARFDLPVKTRVHVRRLHRAAAGFEADTSAGAISAAGRSRQWSVPPPSRPGRRQRLDESATQLRSFSYRLSDVPSGDVLVVDRDSSAVQLAIELDCMGCRGRPG